MTAQTREALGNRIRELRKANGLSQQKLALMVNVERSYLAKLEQGKRNPSIDCLEKIAGGLDVTLSELFAGLETSGTDAIRNPKADAISIASSSVRNGYFALKLPSE
ncbi:MAG: helix-turn-helix transcriptional regulator [Eggerthellaceae bacterium]|nr:helix-turn-helix transcriptional regulator [Eggerthellaceae bacterium]MBQ9044191.1 helix-turn-helix transcriptional regulator [Eggerthellaceae bacterium]